MMVLLVVLSGWMTPTVEVEISGDAAYYKQDLMVQVAEYRGMDLAGYDGGVALMSCGDLGREVWLQFASHASTSSAWLGPFLVVDCSREDHYEMNVDRGRVVDVGWSTWEAHDLPARPVPAVVRFELPPFRRTRSWPALMPE